MRVRAIARGFYGRLYEPGQVFDIVDDQSFGSWMEPVEEADKKRMAERLTEFAKNRRATPPPGVPPTTGPGYLGSHRDAIMPKPAVQEPPATKAREPKA